MQIPDHEPTPADLAVIGVFRANLDDVLGAIQAVIETTGWSVLDAYEYVLPRLNWLKGSAATVVLRDLTGWSEEEAHAYLFGNRDRLAETVRELPGALQVTDVTRPQALRLAAMRAQRLLDLERQQTDDSSS